MGMIGNSLAQGLVSGANIQDGTVDTPDLKDGGVTPAKLSTGHPLWDTTGQLTLPRNDTSNEGGQINFQRAVDGTASWYIDLYGNTTTPSMRFVDGANVRMTIDGSGNVGLGAALPTTKLHVYGGNATVESSTNSDGNIRLKNTGAHYLIGMLGSAGSTGLSFYDITNSAERMRIDASGNVGIGVSQTNTGLTLAQSKTLSWQWASNTYNYANIFNQNSSAGLILASGYQYSSTANGFASSVPVAWDRSAIHVGSGGVKFYADTTSTVAVGTDITPTERARIDSSGRFIMGGGSWQYGQLEVVTSTAYGAARFQQSSASGYTGEVIQVIANQASGTGYNLLAAYYGGGAAYAFRVRGDGVLFAQNTTVQSASDARFKENITNSTEGLNVVNALRPVRFDIKEGHGVTAKSNQLGFIAQEVKAVFPDAVDVWKESDDPENPYLSLGTTTMIPVLVKAIQEQQALIEQMSTRLAALEAK